MSQQSIDAYDLPARVASYDADMEIMHPNRAKMVEIALDVLPFETAAPLRALDLGVGTGFFSARFMARFPAARVVAIDGARAMLDLATARFGADAARVEFAVADFRTLHDLALTPEGFDVVYSSFALHHLSRAEKTALVRNALALLRPGGWFVNADIVVAGSREIEARIQALRLAGIVARARGADPRFGTIDATRRFIDDLQARDGDQPLTLEEDLAVLRDAGVRGASVFWSELREAVCGGYKS
ncbi:MAG: class I SAM-dependent methyltransferase [bacterium]